jgi:signal transduction histidine kinase
MVESGEHVDAAGAALALVAGLPADSPVALALLDAEARVLLASPALAAVTGAREPSGRLERLARQVAGTGTSLDLELETERDGEPVHLLVALHPVATEDACVGVAVSDVTVRDGPEAELRAARQQRAVAELGALGLGGDDVHDLLQHACELVAEGLQAEFAGVQELSRDTGALALRRYVAPDGFVPRTAIPPGERTLSGYAIETDGPVLVEDWAHERRFPPSGPAAQGEARSAMCVPIHTPHRVYGTLTAYGVTPRRFSAEEIGFMQGAAHVIGEAIARRETADEIAQLAGARGRLVAQALDGEARARRGISDRLHDGPLQDLLAAGHDLYGLGDGPDAMQAQARLRAIARDLREVMFALHPSVLRYGGLRAALEAVAGQLAHAGGFTAVVDVDPEATGIHDELLLSLGRQLVADARHAAVSRVALTLRRDGDRLRLLLAHDARADEGRLGLAAATERVAAVGGRLDAVVEPAGGMRITVELPVA